MSWTIIIIIILIGITLAALEIVALPGGIAGAIGGILTALAIWQTYTSHGTKAGNIVLISSIIVFAVLIIIFLKSKTWQRFTLKEAIDSKVNVVDENEIHVGSIGITTSRLAPSGNALFGDQIKEVHSVSEFIDPNTTIEVIEVDGYKITVQPHIDSK